MSKDCKYWIEGKCHYNPPNEYGAWPIVKEDCFCSKENKKIQQSYIKESGKIIKTEFSEITPEAYECIKKIFNDEYTLRCMDMSIAPPPLPGAEKESKHKVLSQEDVNTLLSGISKHPYWEDNSTAENEKEEKTDE